MNLRCFTCGRNVPDVDTRVAGRNDLGDDVHLCADCDCPPHARARSQTVTTEPFGVIPRWGTHG